MLGFVFLCVCVTKGACMLTQPQTNFMYVTIKFYVLLNVLVDVTIFWTGLTSLIKYRSEHNWIFWHRLFDPLDPFFLF